MGECDKRRFSATKVRKSVISVASRIRIFRKGHIVSWFVLPLGHRHRPRVSRHSRGTDRCRAVDNLVIRELIHSFFVFFIIFLSIVLQQPNLTPMHDDTAHDHSPTAVEASEPTRATFQSRSRVKSNLSAEQLRQKRLVDRRAQQAFRERNKEKVRHLEQELNDLRAEWQSREKELLQDMQHIREQNETLLHRLRNIASLATTATDVDHAFPDAYDQGEAEVGNAADVIKSPSPRASSPQSSTVPQSERNTLPASALGDDIVALPDDQPPTDPRSASLLVPSTDVVPLLHSRTVAFDQGRTALAHFQDTDSRLTSVTANAAPVSPTSINNSAKVSPDRDPARLVSAILPLHLPPTCPLDHILLGCLQSNRSALSEGESPELVTGPERASVKRFIDQQPDSTTHAMSRVMSEVMSTYPSVGKAEQLALFYLMHQTMRVITPVYSLPVHLLMVSVDGFSCKAEL
jgi:hypothetical protein